MNRPYPPDYMISEGARFEPSEALALWIKETFVHGHGPLLNDDHAHLMDATIGCLWTNMPYKRKMKEVAGQAEIPMFRCGAWQKGRQEQQIDEWFDSDVDFIITLSAPYAAKASDAAFCALVEHELYHCSYLLDEFDCPKYTADGKYRYAIMGHDVEEFIGVVARYGPVGAGVSEMVEAAKRIPILPASEIAYACGTCELKLA